MRVATLQFAPRVGEVEANARRAEELLLGAENLNNVDLIVCPEMSLSGKSDKSHLLAFR